MPNAQMGNSPAGLVDMTLAVDLADTEAALHLQLSHSGLHTRELFQALSMLLVSAGGGCQDSSGTSLQAWLIQLVRAG